MPFAFPELPTLPEFTAAEPLQLQMPSMQMQMPTMPSASDMMAQMQAQMQSQMQMQMASMQQVHQQMPSMMLDMGAGFPNLGGMYFLVFASNSLLLSCHHFPGKKSQKVPSKDY